MFLCVSDVNNEKRYINVNRIKEFKLSKVNPDDKEETKIIFQTLDLNVYHIDFNIDQIPVMQKLIMQLCNLGREFYLKNT